MTDSTLYRIPILLDGTPLVLSTYQQI